MVNNLLVSAFREIQKLPRVPQVKYEFEHRVLKILLDIAKMENIVTPKGSLISRHEKFTEWDRNKRWGVVWQPNGPNQYSDFMLILAGHGLLCVEAKSSGGGKAMWNGGPPINSGIYIYNGTYTKKYQGSRSSNTTFALGEELATPEEMAWAENERRIAQKNTEDAEKRSGNGRYHLQTTRLNFGEKLTKDARLLEQEFRESRENNVIEYITKLLSE